MRSPGGVIRWHEARDEYLAGSKAARDEEDKSHRRRPMIFSLASSKWQKVRSNGRHYHMSLSRVLERHFERVEGVNGFYVLKSTIIGDQEDDR